MWSKCLIIDISLREAVVDLSHENTIVALNLENRSDEIKDFLI